MVLTQLEYEEQVKQEYMREYLCDDRVAQNITYHRFVSKSKGIRNGKRRIRRRWKEIHLVRYRGGVQPMGPLSLRCLCHRDHRPVC